MSESVKHSDGEVFVSLEDMPIVLADIRAALPQLRQELVARWSIIEVEIQNRRPTRQRNPFDPTHIVAAVLGIRVVYLLGRTAQVFLDEVARATGAEIGEQVRNWIRRVAARSCENRGVPTAKKKLPHKSKRH